MGRTGRGSFDTTPLVARALTCALLVVALGAVSTRREEKRAAPAPARAAMLAPRHALCTGAPGPEGALAPARC